MLGSPSSAPSWVRRELRDASYLLSLNLLILKEVKTVPSPLSLPRVCFAFLGWPDQVSQCWSTSTS